MKVAILQLSDIHIKSADDFIFQHAEDFWRSCKHHINECAKLIIVITGDIAYHGAKEEYDMAYNWLRECEQSWKKEAQFLNSIEYVMVPGNHDCSFTEDPIRDILIEKVLKEDVFEKKQVVDVCLKIQRNFWDFYKRLCSDMSSPLVSWSRNVRVKVDFSLIFNCYNTAFLSQLSEKPGTLLIPENYLITSENAGNKDVVLSLFHHNTGWLTPNTPHNNKKIFEQHLYKNSNIVMCGHEHSDKHQIITNISDYKELVYLENAALQSGDESNYGLLILDTEERIFKSFSYSYNNGFYNEKEEREYTISKNQTGVMLSKDWEEKLNSLNIPLKHARKEDLVLSDIFVYPDLEPLQDGYSKIVQYLDSSQLIETSVGERVSILEGENQSGKSSLLQMLYMAWFKTGVFPILINGKEIKHYNINNSIKAGFKSQYQTSCFTFDQYMQLDINKRILIIDNFDKSEINAENKAKLLDNALCNFKRIVITKDQQIDLKNILLYANKTNDFKVYRILSLGCEKRNQLIEKWIKLGQDSITSDEQALLDQIKSTYDQISVLLGQQLIPSYPIFILSLLQGLNHAIDNFDVSKTSYAYCYNSLIIASLLKSGAEKDKISGILKYLSEFAYNHYTTKGGMKLFANTDFAEYYHSYKREYNVPYSCEKLLSLLEIAGLLSCADGESYTFAYKYVYYYLVAQKISHLINDNQAQGIVQKLCDNLHKEQEANILIFLVYHNGTEKQMEDLLFASMLPFENYQPITLELNDPLFKGINDIVETIKAKVMLEHVDPKENREVELRKNDIVRRELDKSRQPSEEELEDNKCLRELNNTIKIIKILGQIAKNQMETLKKDQIIKLLEESYNVCFRSIAFFSKMIEASKDDITDFILERNKDKAYLQEDDIRLRVQKLLHMLLYQFCLQSFANLSRSVGTSNVPEVYNAVAEKFGTPAAKIISFTIKTYYNKMRLVDLESIVNEYRNNPVVMEIIKARVLNYVYNNYVDTSIRQKIGQICELKLINNGIVQNNIQKRRQR